MHLARILVCIALVSQVCFADFASLSFSGNVTVNAGADDGNSFSARNVNVLVGNLAGLVSGYAYSSFTAEGAPGSLTVDSVVGGGLLVAGAPPVLYLSHKTGTLSWAINNILDFDASSSGNFMANVYTEIVEKNSAGATVKTYSLVQNPLVNTAVSWGLQGSVNTAAEGRLKWATYRARAGGSVSTSWYLDMTLIASSVIGRLDDAAVNAYVSPKSIEVVIQIENYPYASAGNYLALGVASCSGTATGTVSSSSVITGSGLDRMYLFVNTGARINGSPQQVTVDAWATIDSNAYNEAIKSTALKSMLQSKFNSNFECKKTYVNFPAGAASITFDPTLGAGATLAESSNAATVAFSFIVLVASLIAALAL